jgi:hypothetical protein
MDGGTGAGRREFLDLMFLESDPESLFLVSLRSVSRLFSMSTFRKERLSGWTSS